jgi:putative transposase
MQQKRFYKPLYFVSKGIDTREYSQETYEKYDKLMLYKELKDQNCKEETILKILNISRSTYFKWKKAYNKYGLRGLEPLSKSPINKPKPQYDSKLKSLVLKIRKENPVWGKNKIFKIIQRDYKINTSISTVGRIITLLIKEEKVKHSRFYYGRIKNKKPRIFNKHAKRWKYGIKAKKLGELLQLDHAVIEVEPGKYVKHFDITCPITKLTHSQVYFRATSGVAASFLDYIQKLFPFPIESIQVDGGSEFMDLFESACKEKNIELYVLPPKSPKFNGNVERRHGTIKYEFYSTYDGSADLEAIRAELMRYISKYNRYRPHQSLGLETPWDYYLNLTKKSQMS